MPLEDDAKQRDKVAKAVWEDLAAKARGLHCPEHFVEPWRVVVSGSSAGNYRLQIYGCCSQLQTVVSALIKADPRIGGPA